MWSLWKALPKSQTKPGWEQFQHQFRVKNPEVGVNGYLEVNHTYTLPAEPESDATDTTAGGDPGTATVGAPGTMPTGLADGSSPAAAIPVTAAEAWAATG